MHFLWPIRDRHPSSVSYSLAFFVIIGFIIIKSYNPLDTQIIDLLYPIIFAANPTHLSLFAFNVSSNSYAIYLSFSVAFSAFCDRNSMSFTICFTMLVSFVYVICWGLIIFIIIA